MALRSWLASVLMVMLGVLAAPAWADPSGGEPAPETAEQTAPAPENSSGGQQVENSSRPRRAQLRRGKVIAPPGAPPEVVAAIRAANRIVGRPYVYGGGHASFRSAGYDCSGTVSYALHGGGLLRSPLASGPLMSWGRPGRGRWITVYTNSGHAWMTIAGIRLDTSTANDPSGARGPRWRPRMASTAGYRVRHPAGL